MNYKFLTLQGKEIKFRTISATDADKFFTLLKLNDSSEAEEFVFNEITDNAYDLESLPAGVIINTIFAAFKVSGIFKSEESIPDYIEEARKEVDNNVYSFFHSIIIKFMPSYKPEELKTKSIKELLELVALAEKINGSALIDVKAMRKSLEAETKNVKKGIAGVTKQEIKALMQGLDMDNTDGVPLK